MNDDLLNDLKQFMTALLAQSEERLSNDMSTGFQQLRTEIADGVQQVRTEMAHGLQQVRTEMADGFAGVGEAIEEIYKQSDEANTSLDARLTRLEQQTAK